MLPSVRVAAMLLVAVLALVVSGWFWLAVTFACGLVFLSGIFLRLSAAAMSTVNYAPGETRANLAIVPTLPNGFGGNKPICVSSVKAHVVVDILGQLS